MSPSSKREKGPERVGDITGEPPENIATDREKAARMANLLEGLEFPATKEEILDHIRKSRLASKEEQDVADRIKDYLRDKKEYRDAYHVEQAVGLVRQVYSETKPYVRDKALNEANKQRLGQKPKPDPYEQNPQQQ